MLKFLKKVAFIIRSACSIAKRPAAPAATDVVLVEEKTGYYVHKARLGYTLRESKTGACVFTQENADALILGASMSKARLKKVPVKEFLARPGRANRAKRRKGLVAVD